MLLNIYLGTTAISWAVTFIFSNAYDKKIKREGYKFVKEKKTFPEKTASFISTTFILSIPVYNILNAVSILIMPDKFYENMKDKLLEQGKIYKPISKESNNDYDNQILNEEKININTESIQKVRTEKTYNDMTNEEKIAYLQQEKEKLINEATFQDKNSFTLSKRNK